jgi:hypothetical protein
MFSGQSTQLLTSAPTNHHIANIAMLEAYIAANPHESELWYYQLQLIQNEFLHQSDTLNQADKDEKSNDKNKILLSTDAAQGYRDRIYAITNNRTLTIKMLKTVSEIYEELFFVTGNIQDLLNYSINIDQLASHSQTSISSSASSESLPEYISKRLENFFVRKQFLDREIQAITRRIAADVYFDQLNDPKNALQHATAGLALAETEETGALLVIAAKCYVLLKKPVTAIQRYEEALKKKLSDPNDRLEILNSISLLHCFQNDHEKATDAFARLCLLLPELTPQMTPAVKDEWQEALQQLRILIVKIGASNHTQENKARIEKSLKEKLTKRSTERMARITATQEVDKKDADEKTALKMAAKEREAKRLAEIAARKKITKEFENKVARDKAQRKAAEKEAARALKKATRQQAEKEEAAKIAQEKAEKEAAKEAAKATAERIAKEKAAKKAARKKAAKAKKDAAAKAAQEQAEKEAIEKAAREKAEKAAAEKIAQEKEEKRLADKAAQEKAAKDAIEKADKQIAAIKAAMIKNAQEKDEKQPIESIKPKDISQEPSASLSPVSTNTSKDEVKSEPVHQKTAAKQPQQKMKSPMLGTLFSPRPQAQTVSRHQTSKTNTIEQIDSYDLAEKQLAYAFSLSAGPDHEAYLREASLLYVNTYLQHPSLTTYAKVLGCQALLAACTTIIEPLISAEELLNFRQTFLSFVTSNKLLENADANLKKLYFDIQVYTKLQATIDDSAQTEIYYNAANTLLQMAGHYSQQALQHFVEFNDALAQRDEQGSNPQYSMRR